jgi:hypothetical protein
MGDDPKRLAVTVDRVSVEGQTRLGDFNAGIASGILASTPVAVGATLVELPGVVQPFRVDYADLEQDPRANDTGLVIAVRLTLEGLKDKRLPVRWALLDAGCRPPLVFAISTTPVATIVPRAETDTGDFEIWVQRPPRTGRYMVRVEVRDAGGAVRGSGTSEPAEVLGGGPPVPACASVPTG